MFVTIIIVIGGAGFAKQAVGQLARSATYVTSQETGTVFHWTRTNKHKTFSGPRAAIFRNRRRKITSLFGVCVREATRVVVLGLLYTVSL